MSKSFTCPKCNITMSSKQSLKRHLDRIRSCDAEKNFNCKFCDKSFTHNTNRYRHQKTCKKAPGQQTTNNNNITNNNINLNIDNRSVNYKIINNYCANAVNFEPEKYDWTFSEDKANNYIKPHPAKGVANLIMDKMMNDKALQDRSIWCIDYYRKIFLVRVSDNWVKDIHGTNITVPKIKEIRENLIDFGIQRISEINDEICNLDDILDDHVKDTAKYFEIETKLQNKETERLCYYNFCNGLQNIDDIDTKILYRLSKYIIFDKHKKQIISVDDNIADYLKTTSQPIPSTNPPTNPPTNHTSY